MNRRVYIDKTASDAVFKLYGKKEEGLSRSVSVFLLLRKIALRQLTGHFTRPELTGIVAAFNGTAVNFGLVAPKAMLAAQMGDSIALEQNHDVYGYDPDALLGKISALSESDALFVCDEVARFWDGPDGEDSLDRFLDRFAAKSQGGKA